MIIRKNFCQLAWTIASFSVKYGKQRLYRVILTPCCRLKIYSTKKQVIQIALLENLHASKNIRVKGLAKWKYLLEAAAQVA